MKSIKDIPIGIYEKALPSYLNWPERLEMVSKTGYDFLEICIDESEERLSRLNWDKEKRFEIIKAISDTNVPILTMALSGNRKYPIGSDNKETRDYGLEIIRKAIEFSKDVGIRIIQLAGYDEYYNESNERTKQNFLNSLQKCVEWASIAGVMLTIETMDTKFINSISKAMMYVKKINSPWLQVYPDIGNISAWHKDIEDEVINGSGHVVAFHIKDTREREFRRVPFGDGVVDFVNFFRLLEDSKFRGLFVVEMWCDNSDDAFETAQKARNWVRNKIESVITKK